MNTRFTNRIRMTLAVAAAVLPVCAGSASAAIIQLQESAEVNSSVIRLGDIAVVRDVDPQVIKRLEGVVLAPAPSPQTRLPIQLATIRSALQARGVNLANVEFSGKSLVIVSSANPDENRSKRLSPQTIEQQHVRAEELVGQAVRQYLKGQAPGLDHYSLEIEIGTKDVPLVLSAAGRGYFVRGGGPPWDKPQVMYVRFLDSNENPREIRITTTITPLPLVLVARYTIPRGRVLRKVDLAFSRAEKVTDAVIKLENAVGKETTRTIRKGEVIKTGDVKTVPLVRQNDIVSVHSRKPGIVVTRQFKARSEGGMDETITLVSLDGRQKLIATVVGFHEAEVVGSEGPTIIPPPSRTSGFQFRPGFSRRPSYHGETLESLSPISTIPYSNAFQTGSNYRVGGTPQRVISSGR